MMLNLAHGFAERGHAVDFVLAQAEGPFIPLVAANVRIVDLKASRVLSALPGLVRYLRSEKPNAMLSAMGHANIVAIWAKLLSGIRVRLAVSVRNTLSMSTANSKKPFSSFLPSLSKWFYPIADAIIAVSRGVAEDFSKVSGFDRDAVTVIYNPVVTSDLSVKAKEILDHPWFSPQAPPVIIGVGRLNRQKDFETLIRAFDLVWRGRDLRLMILGEGNERPALEGIINELGLGDRVSLPGFVDNPFKYLNRAGVFVLSSAWEGLPGVLIQAMACGAPVVSTDCPSGPGEILENGKWGRMVPVGDVEAMAGAIIATLDEFDHPDVRARANDFGLSQAVDGYLRILLPK